MHNTLYSQQAGEVVGGSWLRRSSRSAGRLYFMDIGDIDYP